MKKAVCVAILAVLLMISCAGAEEIGTEMWAHEAGWMSFQLALSQDSLDEVWVESAKSFGESLGVANLPVESMKRMLLAGFSMESGVEELYVEGNRITGRNADGTEVFSHEYAWKETIEDEKIMGGKKVHVFRTEEKGAGDYTCLLMTEPVKTEGENAGYVTFNLFCLGDKYRERLTAGKDAAVPMPCTMVEKDTETAGLVFAVERMFKNPVIIR